MNRTSETYIPDQLIAGEDDIVSQQITLLSGQNQPRGAVLGKTITAGTISGAAVAGNTGNGTIGTLSVGGAAKPGVYRATCITAATNSGTFKVVDPSGNYIGNATVAVAFNNEVNFTIADGATDFAVGDAFTISVSALTEKYLLSVATANDGSQYPDCILVENTDASLGDTATIAYIEGQFSANHITIGAGHTVDSVRDALRLKDIHIINTTA